MPRTGADYLTSLRDERTIYLDGERVRDIESHPAFKSAVRTIAGMYDFQAAPENQERMTFVSPRSNDRVNRQWQLPRNHAELVERRKALEAWAGLHFGFMGRSPDHVASTISAMVMGLDVFESRDQKRARAMRDYYEYARDRDLYISYVIIDPQADRSKAAGEQKEDLVVSIVDEDSDGITVKGAKMLGTGAVFSDEILVSTLRPIRPEDERYAFSAVVPMGAKGVTALSRRSYEQNSVSGFDYPLAARFDENDALMYFDEVKIPWERVLVHRDVDLMMAHWHQTPAHMFQNYQSAIRLMVKMRFLVGLAHRITEATGSYNFPPVKETLGQLSSYVSQVESFVYGMEANGTQLGSYFIPDRNILYGAQVVCQELYPKVVQTIRTLAGGGLIMLPSSVADFANPAVSALIRRTQVSPTTDAVGRVKLFKLAWDALGSEFASRHTQYEMFYSGPSVVTHNMAYRNFDWGTAKGLVDGFLASYDLPAQATTGKERGEAKR